jgi:hypothetical protein
VLPLGFAERVVELPLQMLVAVELIETVGGVEATTAIDAVALHPSLEVI